MPNITSCPNCGELYEAASEESAESCKGADDTRIQNIENPPEPQEQGFKERLELIHEASKASELSAAVMALCEIALQLLHIAGQQERIADLLEEDDEALEEDLDELDAREQDAEEDDDA